MSRIATEHDLPHIVIRASAGAGKTYQLANRYLQLAMAGHAPEQILAATFARKAAGEILDRVVTRLATAIYDPVRLAELAASLSTDGLDRAECIGMLRTLLGRLHRLQIGTLDSFFMQLARHFSLDLGLPLGWRIVDDLEDRNLRQEAIQEVLAENGSEDSVALMRLLSKGDASRSVTQQILEIVNDLYAVYHDTTPEMWKPIKRPTTLEQSAIADALTQLAALPQFESKMLAKAHVSAVAAAERQDWDSFLDKGIGCAIACNGGVFSGKPIAANVVEAYLPLVKHAKDTLVARVVDQTAATYKLLSRFDIAYRRLKIDRSVMRFDDVTHALATAFGDRHVDDLAFRLDGRVAHLLLDEFQDTSRHQWSVLLPFAVRATESKSGGSFFCVGDTKQAIYGWRGGVAEIFDSATRKITGICEKSLSESYRSAPPIIDTVNRAFANLACNRALDEFPKVVANWAPRFVPHSTAKKHLPGFCRLMTAPRAEKATDQQATTLDYAAEHIAYLARDNPQRTIGVLVRENAAVGRLIYFLRTEHDVLASEEGGNPLTDSPAVQLVLSLLRLSDHPGDSVAAFHVAQSALGASVGFTNHEDRRAAQQLALEVRERLLREGYGPVIYDWTKSLSEQCGARDANRLMQLVEMAHVLDDGKLRRPDDFVAQVELRRVEDPTSANVRVMTVHQAKGLQFDIVVLPQLDRNLKGQPPRLVVDRPDPLDPIVRVCRYTGSTVQQFLPDDMAEMFASWSDGLVNEALCVLYVAMTRAIYALDMIIAPSKESEKTWPKTAAGVVRSALATGVAAPEAILYRHGDPDWAASAPVGALDSDGAAIESPIVGGLKEPLRIGLRSSPARRRGLDTRAPSGLEGGSTVNLRQRLHLDLGASLVRGKLMHVWFEQIGWLEDGFPDDTALRKLAGPIVGAQLKVDEELRRFHKMLKRPAVSTALSRSRYSPLAGNVELELRREWRFAHRQADIIVEGAMDRLVLYRDRGALIGAEIIDFKTDAVTDAAATALRVEFYRPQIQAYRQALAGITGLASVKISATLLFVEIGAVETIA